MSNKDEAAFACPDSGTESITTWQGQKGLTKLEYFTGLAMQGILSAQTKTGFHEPNSVASKAVKQAYEILKQLES